MLILGQGRRADAPTSGGVVHGIAYSTQTNTTSSTLALPSGITAGNTLLGVMRLGVPTASAAPTISAVPSGWSLVGSETTDKGIYLYKKAATGSEGGTNATWTTNVNCNSVFRFWEIGIASAVVEVTWAADSLDPPSHTPTGGVANTIWLAITSCRRGDNSVTAPPASYGSLAWARSWIDGNTTVVSMAGAHAQWSDDTEDPGTFTWTGTQIFPQSATISVRAP